MVTGKLGQNPSTVSKWCANVAQPDLAALVKGATLLDVDIQELINKREFGISDPPRKLNRQLEKVADSFGNIPDI